MTELDVTQVDGRGGSSGSRLRAHHLYRGAGLGPHALRQADGESVVRLRATRTPVAANADSSTAMAAPTPASLQSNPSLGLELELTGACSTGWLPVIALTLVNSPPWDDGAELGSPLGGVSAVSDEYSESLVA